MKKRQIKYDLEHTDEVFYPSFLFKEIFVMMLIFILVAIILAIYFPVELGNPADPTDNEFIPKPEWYFLAIYELLRFFPGKLEFFATAIIPGTTIIILFLLPFIDTSEEQRPRKRPIAMALLIITVIAILGLTILGL